MKIGYLVLGTLLFTVVSCGSSETSEADKKEPTKQEVKQNEDVHPDEDSKKVVEQEEMTVPAFKIDLALSEKAVEKLQKSKETIMIDVSFSGELKASSKMEVSEDGQFYIANASREIKPGQVANFDDIVIPIKILNELKNKDFEVSVNVYSGRKVFKNNILSTLGAFGKISEFKNKKITIEGKLIEEE